MDNDWDLFAMIRSCAANTRSTTPALPEIYQDPLPPPPPSAIMPTPVCRKNQQKKLFHLTQEDISADTYAWRKYGQKPIKGSPFLRNYYRCTTSKKCAVKKQVEHSPTNDGYFVVSFIGEHNHARPTHRSSLSGSTRTKFNSNNALLLDRAASSQSSSASSLSPATPSMPEEENAAVDENTFGGFQDSVGDWDLFPYFPPLK